jgi:hypothetical protein
MEKVAHFYKDKAGLQAQVEPGRTSLIGKTPAGSDVIIELTPSDDGKGTKILVTAKVYSK